MLRSIQDSTYENDFGVKSVDDSTLFNSKSNITKRTSISTSSSFPLKDGIGKSALVHALTTLQASHSVCSLEPIEHFVPFTNICVVDTCGYGASMRPEVIFSNTKKYLEKQFEKTNGLFHPSCRDDQRLIYMLEKAPAILTHVDVCLYLITGRLKPVDIEYMRYIHELVNIIPVMIQPDLSVRMDQMLDQRLDIIHVLIQNQIRFCTFGYTQDEIIVHCKQASTCSMPFVLNWSSAKPSFHGLTYLKQALFDTYLNPLRKQTTQRFLQWRQQQVSYVSNVNISNSISSSLSTSSSINSLTSAEKQKVSEYVSNRRRQLEKELLKQDKELKQEFEKLSQKHKREYLAKEVGFVDVQNNHLYYNRFVFAIALCLCLCVVIVFNQYNNKKHCFPP
ncbi:hypothetical protein G6F56_002927 [Rhizopus delemar]|nr:hypothetical protein G6F56_002927 [Rhizopus delemar]